MKWSFAGWDWHTWLKGEVGAIKTLVAAAIALLAGYLTSPPLSPEVASTLALVLGIVSRALLSLVDFWVQDTPGTPPQ